MLKFNVFLFIITIYVAKSEEDFETVCKNNYRDEKNNQIDVSQYCSTNLCIEKCCGPGEIISLRNHCANKTTLLSWFKKKGYSTEHRFKEINVFSSLDVHKKLKKNVHYVYNQRVFNICTAEPMVKDYEILEDGSIKWQDNETKKWIRIGKLDYCIDYKLFLEKNKTPDVKITMRLFTISDKDRGKIEVFEVVAIQISSFFLILVLVVYCLLPNLRNLSGLILMAYTFSLLFAFLNKLVLIYVKRDPPKAFCKLYSPVVYFAFMASIFWLNVLSYDVWSGLRALRIKQRSKLADLVRFMWYNLYAWGTPLLITAIVVTLDNMVDLDITEPPFNDCLMEGRRFDYYFKIPVGILIFINIVLFFMTGYHIWAVRRAINKHQDSKNSNQQNKKASTYAKLSVMMGLSWCLELLPSTDWIWLFIFINLYNILTGVTIFYWFVCDKKVLLPLCKMFNIQSKFTKKWEAELSQSTKSTSTKSTRTTSSIVKTRPKDENEEKDLINNP